MHSKYFNPKYIVGAYTTSPNLFTWDPITEKKYFNGLKSLDYLLGLELNDQHYSIKYNLGVFYKNQNRIGDANEILNSLKNCENNDYNYVK